MEPRMLGLLVLLARLMALLAPVAAQLELQPLPGGRGRLSSGTECSILCVCSMWHKLPKASCAGKRLYSIHAGVSTVAQALDLSNNSISILEDRGFSRAGLTRLKYLNLSMNAINEIGPSAFDDLHNLMVLDLSKNHIDYVAPETFYYNKNLRILNLAGNKFNRDVPKLHSASIVDLDLSGCRINYLDAQIFGELKQLRKLNLASNQLTQLSRDVLLAVPSLEHLQLGQNPWACNVAMFSLKRDVRKMNITLDQICQKPTLEKIIAESLETNSGGGGIELAKTTKQPVPERIAAAEFEQPWNVESWREFEEAIAEGEQPSAESEASSIFASTLNNASPVWFLLTGFLLGSGASMLVTYLWLSTTISCLIPRIRRAETVDSPEVSSQRVSLLRHLWQQENSLSTSEDSSRGGGEPSGPTVFLPALGTTPSCPGTPPPPYREVMLHRNLYPRAAMVAAAAAQQASARSLSANE